MHRALRVVPTLLPLVLAALVDPIASRAQPVARRIAVGDGALLLGGPDAQGGVGDWYVSNGVVAAVIDDVGAQPDLVGVVPAGSEPPLQSQIAPTGGTIVDVARAGVPGDHLPQHFLVGGLSTANFVVYDTVTAPSPGVVRSSGALLLPPVSQRPAPCIEVVTEVSAAGSDPFLGLVTTATNACPVAAPLTGFLDAFIWTQRGLLPFSGGGSGFDHVPIDLANPAPALETPRFMAAPGMLVPADGVIDPTAGTIAGEVSYGLLPVALTIDEDGPAGPAAPVTTPIDALFGVSSTLVTALGSFPTLTPLPPGGTFTWVRRLYVGDRGDVRSVADGMIAALSARLGFATGTVAGDVDAADAGDVEASIVLTRLGRCAGGGTPCTAAAACGGGVCEDPVPVAAFPPGSAVTQVRTDARGGFAGVVVPQGDYRLAVVAPGRQDVVVEPVTVGAGETRASLPSLSARGTLRVTVREKRRGRPLIPAKVVVKGVDGTADPRFARMIPARLGREDIRTETFGGGQRDAGEGAIAQGNVVYLQGTGSVPLRPGTYEVWASRGMEYGIARRRVTVAAGATADVSFLVKRVLRTRDALSADFHVHSARSLDSSAPLAGRVASFAGEGVEVMVSTDHDQHVDYAPVIASLQLQSRITSVRGVEVTGSVPNPPAFPNAIGHVNGWPMPLDPTAPRGGAPQDEWVAPNWVFTRLRRLGGADVVVQYNHPRAGVSGLTSIGIFNSIGCGRCTTAIDTACTQDAECPAGGTCDCVGFQPDRPLEQAPNDVLLDAGVLGPGSTPNPDGTRNLDFDVMEIANGARAEDFGAFLQVREDWLALLAQGVVRPGTAVSDSHRLTVEHAGWARTFVLGVGDDPASVDIPFFNRRVKAGAMLMSAGPWIEVAARAGRTRVSLGDTLVARGGKVALRVRVESAAWVPVPEVRVLVNGEVAQRFDAGTRPRVRPVPSRPESSGGTLRFARTLRLRLERDAHVIVEAGVPLPAAGTTPTSPEPLDTIQPGVVPVAVTNPVFVDVDGDGWRPPGLGAAAQARAARGRMTAPAREERDAAARRGEWLPLGELVLPVPGS